jgi:nucleoside-diphosphate-sugar epimerase
MPEGGDVKNVLITGATGFIGGHLVKANLEKGNRVRAFVLPDDPKAKELDGLGVEVFLGDIRDPDAVNKAVQGMDRVFHTAAVVTDWAPMQLFQDVTVKGTENVCRAALSAKVERMIDISTNDVFGTDESIFMDESLPLSPWGEPYPDTKIEAEKITWKYHEQGLPVTMVYPCWVFGEGDQTFVPLLADAIIKKEMIFWRKDVLVWPTYIGNLIDLLMLISVDDRAVGQGYLVHDGRSITLQAFCEHIARELNVEPTRRHIPYSVTYAAAVVLETVWRLLRKKQRPLLTTYTVKNLGSRLKFTINKAERELGWTPPISYDDGFRRTMEWLKTLDLESLKQK